VWTFDYLSAAGEGVRIAVSDGQASEIGAIIFTSPACPASLRPATNVSTPFDSSAIGLLALNLGGATFLSENEGAAVTYSLAPSLEPGSGARVAEEWNVTYDACGASPSASVVTTVGSTLTYLFDAESGTLESTGTSTFSCPLGSNAPIPYPLPEDLELNDPVVMILGTMALYNASIAGACCGLTFANLSIDLQFPDGGPLPAGASLGILNASGAEVCELTGPELTGASVDCPIPVTPGELLSLTLPAKGNGIGELMLDGQWDFTGRVVLALGNATEIPPA
jgi:hypothetical protein